MIGTTIMIVVTLSRNAEKKAVINRKSMNIRSGLPLVFSANLVLIQLKISLRREISIISIIPISRMIVSNSIA